MVGIHSANIAAALMSQTRASLAPAAGSLRPGGADAPALIVDVSGAARAKPEGYDLFRIKQRDSLLDKQIEVATELGDSKEAFSQALASGDVAGIASEAYRLNGLLKAESALSDAVEKANEKDAKKETAALERGQMEAVKEVLEEAVDAADEAKEAKDSGGEVDLDKMAEEAEDAAKQELADAEAAAA
jgi:hypothetical protein